MKTKKSKFILISILALAAFIYISAFYPKTVKPTTTQEYISTSVTITGYNERSGGSGVILSSSRNSSKILTNAHVCGVVKNGGIVRSERTRGVVKSYKVSDIHDLCLITTNNNFRINTVVSNNPPENYEDATVVGHPGLLPSIITKGHFSEKQLITIMTGSRKCEESDLKDPKSNLFCSLFGMLPVIKTFEAQVVSSTIMPGSSGSPVFNSDGEIAGLVFAGSGSFGYAMVVPLEYIVSFLEFEQFEKKEIYPSDNENSSSDELEKRIFSSCAGGTAPQELVDFCKSLHGSFI